MLCHDIGTGRKAFLAEDVWVAVARFLDARVKYVQTCDRQATAMSLLDAAGFPAPIKARPWSDLPRLYENLEVYRILDSYRDILEGLHPTSSSPGRPEATAKTLKEHEASIENARRSRLSAKSALEAAEEKLSSIQPRYPDITLRSLRPLLTPDQLRHTAPFQEFSYSHHVTGTRWRAFLCMRCHSVLREHVAVDGASGRFPDACPQCDSRVTA